MFQIILSFNFSAQAELTDYYPQDLRQRVESGSDRNYSIDSTWPFKKVSEKILATNKQGDFSSVNLSHRDQKWPVVKDVCANTYGSEIGVGEMKIPNPKYINCEHTAAKQVQSR